MNVSRGCCEELAALAASLAIQTGQLARLWPMTVWSSRKAYSFFTCSCALDFERSRYYIVRGEHVGPLQEQLVSQRELGIVLECALELRRLPRTLCDGRGHSLRLGIGYFHS